MHYMNRKTMTNRLFTAYILILCWAIIYKFSVHIALPTVLVNRSVNLIPLAGSFAADGSFCTAEFLFNIAAFVPFGIYLSATEHSMRIRRRVLVFFLVSLAFESLQFIFNIGVFDMTDLLTNTLGGLAGVWIYGQLRSRFTAVGCRRLINVLGSAGTLGVFALSYAYNTGMLSFLF